MHKATRFCVLLCLSFASGGCVPPEFLTHPDTYQRVPQLKRIALLPPRIDVYEIGTGGVLEKMDDWSRTGTENVLNALSSDLGSRQGVQVSQIEIATLSEQTKVELEETRLLFDAVSSSIISHVYGIPAQRFEDKFTNFDYSLGAETAKVNVVDADAFVIVRGFDQVSSGGRHALQAATTVVAAALGGLFIPQGGLTAMNVALVDARTGQILWFTANRGQGTDLRQPWGANAFVRDTLTGFPIK